MAFLLDTVTLSEFRSPQRAAPNVVAWQRTQEGQPGYLSVITLNEIRFGIRLAERKDPDFAKSLWTWIYSVSAQPDVFPILPVDREIAEQAADFRATHSTSPHDSLIAATAKVHDLTVATRNVAHFAPCGISVFDPWEYTA